MSLKRGTSAVFPIVPPWLASCLSIRPGGHALLLGLVVDPRPLRIDPSTRVPARRGIRRGKLSVFPDHRAGTRQRSNRRLRLLLATLEAVPGKPAPILPAYAARLFEGLRLWLRETDVMGWYRQDRVAGAVLGVRGVQQGPRPFGVLLVDRGDCSSEGGLWASILRAVATVERRRPCRPQADAPPPSVGDGVLEASGVL